MKRYKIDKKILEIAYKNARNIESIETQETSESKLEYIGSEINGYLDNDKEKGKIINDYYQDNSGRFWYEDCALLPSGEIVSMEKYIFGRELKKKRRYKII